MRRYLTTIFALVVSEFITSMAHASVSGTATGQFFFWNENGNYCPSNNTCVGSFYPQSVFNTMQPVSNAKVQIVNSSTNALIGQGFTVNDGTFSVSWSAASNPGTIRAIIFPSQKDGRFFLANTAGQLINNTSGGVGVSLPNTNVGSWVVGSPSAPDPWYNAYWAIELQWRNIMSLVGSAMNNFTNVEVRGFADSIPGFLNSCPTSCASGSQKKVQLSADARLTPQGRAMHEVGHIAEYVAHAWSGVHNYNWPDTTAFDSVGGWSFTSGEWGAAAFEEAFATHYGNMTFWADSSSTPTTCITSLTCYSGGSPAASTNIEASSYPFATNNCLTTSPPESRWVLSQTRFFWDVFDNHNDADGDSYSANQGDFWKHLALLAAYPAGTGTDQIDEPKTNRDGRGSGAYSDNYHLLSTATVSTLRVDNCSPP